AHEEGKAFLKRGRHIQGGKRFKSALGDIADVIQKLWRRRRRRRAPQPNASQPGCWRGSGLRSAHDGRSRRRRYVNDFGRDRWLDAHAKARQRGPAGLTVARERRWMRRRNVRALSRRLLIR